MKAIAACNVSDFTRTSSTRRHHPKDSTDSVRTECGQEKHNTVVLFALPLVIITAIRSTTKTTIMNTTIRIWGEMTPL